MPTPRRSKPYSRAQLRDPRTRRVRDAHDPQGHGDHRISRSTHHLGGRKQATRQRPVESSAHVLLFAERRPGHRRRPSRQCRPLDQPLVRAQLPDVRGRKRVACSSRHAARSTPATSCRTTTGWSSTGASRRSSGPSTLVIAGRSAAAARCSTSDRRRRDQIDGEKTHRSGVRHARRAGASVESPRRQRIGRSACAPPRRVASAAVRRRRGGTPRPSAACLLRPRRVHGVRAFAHQLEALRRQRARARRAVDPREEDGSGDLRVSRLLHLARRQPVRELVGDRRVCRLPDQGNHSVRRPRVPHARLTRAPRVLRQVLRRLRRDHSRDEICEALGGDRRPFGRCELRHGLRPRLAEHAERTREVPRAEARPGAVRRSRRSARTEGPRRGPRRWARQAFSRRRVEEGEALERRRPRDHERLHGRDLRPGPEGAARLPAAVQPRDRRAPGCALAELARARPDPPRRQACGGALDAQGRSTSTAAGATSTTSTTEVAYFRSGSPNPAFATRTRNSTTITPTSITGWT